jgi:hypothetical protein
MSVKIDREGTGFRIHLSNDRSRIYARNEDEIVLAIRHYYGGHTANYTEDSLCPLCRACARQEKRRR